MAAILEESIVEPVSPGERDPACLYAGRLVQSWRKARKLTQEECARRVGISRKHLSDFELGKRWPEVPNLQKLLIVLTPPDRRLTLMEFFPDRPQAPLHALHLVLEGQPDVVEPLGRLLLIRPLLEAAGVTLPTLLALLADYGPALAGIQAFLLEMRRRGC